eukprot:TRINITY_DN2945_c0_g1_i1.p1 TRINITY_DN2945_c0_g1~~TRINITY_DN2945_c0_g1_i1.p1  ORF type:complete len:905 (-),score=258.16 TRINITY_DN2945_c0_g1_i1:68-2782(-)
MSNLRNPESQAPARAIERTPERTAKRINEAKEVRMYVQNDPADLKRYEFYITNPQSVRIYNDSPTRSPFRSRGKNMRFLETQRSEISDQDVIESVSGHEDVEAKSGSEAERPLLLYDQYGNEYKLSPGKVERVSDAERKRRSRAERSQNSKLQTEESRKVSTQKVEVEVTKHVVHHHTQEMQIPQGTILSGRVQLPEEEEPRGSLRLSTLSTPANQVPLPTPTDSRIASALTTPQGPVQRGSLRGEHISEQRSTEDHRATLNLEALPKPAHEAAGVIEKRPSLKPSEFIHPPTLSQPTVSPQSERVRRQTEVSQQQSHTQSQHEGGRIRSVSMLARLAGFTGRAEVIAERGNESEESQKGSEYAIDDLLSLDEFYRLPEEVRKSISKEVLRQLGEGKNLEEINEASAVGRAPRVSLTPLIITEELGDGRSRSERRSQRLTIASDLEQFFSLALQQSVGREQGGDAQEVAKGGAEGELVLTVEEFGQLPEDVKQSITQEVIQQVVEESNLREVEVARRTGAEPQLTLRPMVMVQETEDRLGRRQSRAQKISFAPDLEAFFSTNIGESIVSAQSNVERRSSARVESDVLTLADYQRLPEIVRKEIAQEVTLQLGETTNVEEIKQSITAGREARLSIRPLVLAEEQVDARGRRITATQRVSIAPDLEAFFSMALRTSFEPVDRTSVDPSRRQSQVSRDERRSSVAESHKGHHAQQAEPRKSVLEGLLETGKRVEERRSSQRDVERLVGESTVKRYSVRPEIHEETHKSTIRREETSHVSAPQVNQFSVGQDRSKLILSTRTLRNGLDEESIKELRKIEHDAASLIQAIYRRHLRRTNSNLSEQVKLLRGNRQKQHSHRITRDVASNEEFKQFLRALPKDDVFKQSNLIMMLFYYYHQKMGQLATSKK